MLSFTLFCTLVYLLLCNP